MENYSAAKISSGKHPYSGTTPTTLLKNTRPPACWLWCRCELFIHAPLLLPLEMCIGYVYCRCTYIVVSIYTGFRMHCTVRYAHTLSSTHNAERSLEKPDESSSFHDKEMIAEFLPPLKARESCKHYLVKGLSVWHLIRSTPHNLCWRYTVHAYLY